MNTIQQSPIVRRETPFAPWPYFPAEDIEAAARVLASGKVNYWTGQEGRKFEEEFAAFSGCEYAVALANGTVAIELALRVLGIGPGDEVVLTPRTFVASASAVIMEGAVPVSADVDGDTQNITAETIERVLTPKTRAILAVHLAGWPCDMDPILALARERGLYVIEDCAQAHGALYQGRPAGSLADIAAFSFCQDKIMTTAGEGGMLTTNNREWWESAWSIKDHGKSYDAVYNRQHPPGFRWLHERFGTNWRLTEIQSAMGRAALRRMPEWLAARRRNAAVLNERFQDMSALRVTLPPPGVEHAYYKYYVFVRPERLKEGWNRDRIMNEVTARGIPCFSGSCSEIYLEKALEGTDSRPNGRLPVAKELGETSLMFLVHPTLSEQDMRDTCDVVEQVVAEASA